MPFSRLFTRSVNCAVVCKKRVEIQKIPEVFRYVSDLYIGLPIEVVVRNGAGCDPFGCEAG